MRMTGRNDPCPCGSGRSYKDCCGAAREVRSAVVSASVRESAITKLLAFAFQPDFDSDHSVGEVVFWGDLLRDASPGEIQWLMDSEDATIKYNAWFLFDWDVDGQGTAAELFLDDETITLTPLERQFLARLTRAHLRLYEVEAVEPGEGVRLLDLWTGERVFVIERTATSQIVIWDVLGARVAPDGAGCHVFEGGLYLFPASAKGQMLAHFRRLHRRHLRKHPNDDPGAFFRKHGMVFNHLWLKLVAFPEPVRVTTDEGDPLVFCRAIFETDNLDGVRVTIARQLDINPVEEGRFVLEETSGEGKRPIGVWSVEGGRLVFETWSQARVRRGREWLESLLGRRVRYRATSLETLEQTLDEIGRTRSHGPPPDISSGDTAAVRELYDRHYASWLDRPVPALGNRTPRAAAATKLWRNRLTDLLKTFENATARAALHGRADYDFGWIWAELGIDRPSA